MSEANAEYRARVPGPATIDVPIGSRTQDFQFGNFLNAIDHIYCNFLEFCPEFSEIEAAIALRLYADYLEGKIK